MLSEYMGYAKQGINYITNTSTTFSDIPHSKIDNNLILSNTLNDSLAALSKIKEFEQPNLIVVGTQSSGKSSLLNALIGVQLLPTGETMTTRAAIEVQLVNSVTNTFVEFGDRSTGEWCSRTKIYVDDPPTRDQQIAIQDNISTETAHSLGTCQNGILTKNAICIRLYSKTVPNMTFVDLPGLTMTALVSQGQPDDICEQIRDLIRSYNNKRTIILLVCATRADLEADAAMDFCKKMTNGKRIVGCLTKPDLCENNEKVVAYLNRECPPDLNLEHGYFVVKCKTKSDQMMSEVYRAENEFFKSKKAFDRVSDRTGVLKLGEFLHELVVDKIFKLLPELQIELRKLKSDAEKEYGSKLYETIPDTKTGQLSYVNHMMLKYCNNLRVAAIERKPDNATGRNLRDIFYFLREDLREENPFQFLKDDEIMSAVHNSEGISMISPIPPVEIVEFFMQHSDHKPIQKLFQHCESAIKRVAEHLKDQARDAADALFQRFENMKHFAVREVERLLANCCEECTNGVRHVLNVEESYIFTDSPIFAREWTTVTQKCATYSNYPNVLRQILETYFGVVAEQIANHVPKLVVYNIKRMLREMQTNFAVLIHKTADVSVMLVENEETSGLRERLSQTIQVSENCLRAIDNVFAEKA